MQRGAWILTVKEGKEEEYRRAHANVWPELIHAAQEAGFKNHSCFILGRTVIAYIEAENLDAAGARLIKSDVKQRWDKAMSELLEAPSTPTYEEVFHFD
jgi:L-rhamnose mutarotase